MPKRDKTLKANAKQAPPPALGRLGAEQWIAVRQKSGAGPMEPKPRRGTRTQRERDAIEREADTRPENDA